MKEAHILVFANKQDVLGALNVNDVKSGLGLAEMTSHNWFIQPTTATKGEGLFQGLDWLAQQIQSNQFFNRKMFWIKVNFTEIAQNNELFIENYPQNIRDNIMMYDYDPC